LFSQTAFMGCERCVSVTHRARSRSFKGKKAAAGVAVIKNSRSQSVRNESAGPADNGRGVTTSATGRRPSFLLLLLVEGCIERLGGIGEFLSVV
jgi:hypothetical protein